MVLLARRPDRIICRRNDSVVDVDNGTRGTVRAAHPDRIVIDTDAGTVRELPAGYAAEHVAHAYCLTGHGMQGGTVEHATVLATVRDLTKGWSYTALSRARETTRLHIDAASVADAVLEREEHAPNRPAPGEQPRTGARADRGTDARQRRRRPRCSLPHRPRDLRQRPWTRARTHRWGTAQRMASRRPHRGTDPAPAHGLAAPRRTGVCRRPTNPTISSARGWPHGHDN